MIDKINLWLDDMRDPAAFGAIGFVWVKTYNEAIKFLQLGIVEFASLDHDIGACEGCVEYCLHIGDMTTPETTFFNRCPHEKTGYDVVCWLEEHPQFWPPNGVRVHSANPVGRQRMDKHVVDFFISVDLWRIGRLHLRESLYVCLSYPRPDSRM